MYTIDKSTNDALSLPAKCGQRGVWVTYKYNISEAV